MLMIRYLGKEYFVKYTKEQLIEKLRARKDLVENIKEENNRITVSFYKTDGIEVEYTYSIEVKEVNTSDTFLDILFSHISADRQYETND